MHADEPPHPLPGRYRAGMPPTDVAPGALLALDLDGTLIGPQGEVPPDLSGELRAWARAGAHLALLTARGRVPPEVRDWPLHTVTRCYGAWAEQAGQPLWSWPLPDATVRAATEAIPLADRQVGKTLLVTADPGGIVRGPHPAFETAWPQAHGVLKIVRGDTPARLDALAREWSALCETELIRERATRLVLIRRGAGKGAALRELTARLGVPRSRVVAAGDGPADAAMLPHAGTFIRVGTHPALSGASVGVAGPHDLPGVLARLRAALWAHDRHGDPRPTGHDLRLP